MEHPSQKDFRKFLTAHADRVYNHAFRMLGNREDAEEAVQDVFLKAHRGLGDFRGESEEKTWLYRITVNTCLTRLRKRKQTYVDLAEISGERDSIWEKVGADQGNPELELIEKEIRDLVGSALSLLMPEVREILILYHIDGLKYDEIAHVLDIPLGTVGTRLYRARRKLKSALSFARKELER